MKRTGMVCSLFALLAATVVSPADAARSNSNKPTRRAVVTYDNPTLGSASGTGGAACLPCPSFDISKAERWVKMEVHDEASPAPVAFGIQQRRSDGTCCTEVAGPFCGSTGKQPVELTPGLDVLAYVYTSGDVICPGGVGTTGTIRAVFSNAP